MPFDVIVTETSFGDILITEERMIMPERYNAATLIDANLAAGRGERTAIHFGGDRIRYGDLFNRICAMGRALRSFGVTRETRVLLILSDTPAFPVAFFGAMRIGAVPVPVNPLYKAADYRFFLEDSDARIVVADASSLEKLTEALANSSYGCGEEVRVIVTDGSAPNARSLAELLAAHTGEISPADTHRDDMAFWLYSSGSTGKPKGNTSE